MLATTLADTQSAAGLGRNIRPNFFATELSACLTEDHLTWNIFIHAPLFTTLPTGNHSAPWSDAYISTVQESETGHKVIIRF